MTLDKITFEQLLGAIIVAVILIGVYNQVMTAIKTRREEKKRKEQPFADLEARVNDHEQKLKNDYERINGMESAVRILLRVQLSQLDHEISGNSVDKLRESKNEILDFLSRK